VAEAEGVTRKRVYFTRRTVTFTLSDASVVPDASSFAIVTAPADATPVRAAAAASAANAYVFMGKGYAPHARGRTLLSRSLRGGRTDTIRP
jgi:hypothetical protein